MTEASEPTWRAHVDGRLTEIPETIEGVRTALAPKPERLAEFEAELPRTPAPELPALVAAYALPRRAWDAIDARIERLRAGDFSGCAPLEELDGSGGAVTAARR
ncbi:hypothetical protein NX801_12420 [Streptomyces sp. LP05-1]|uniref:Uncharacterized protein n=1 Tax=Streptomyces pyxinae TaxID=2970734 RepID=A0ABT2CH60_9ACTN|nr:hypothetical protein [Streptomyces sp. LP05-1]MCS0636452.1 hypothetical protein [Streptomyces sp. LP05-1]